MKTNPITSFFSGVREEIKKIAWPTRAQTFQITAIVIIGTIITAIYIGALDQVLSYLIQKFLIK